METILILAVAYVGETLWDAEGPAAALLQQNVCL